MKYRVLLIAVVVFALLVGATMLVGCTSSDDEVAVDTTTSEEATVERPAWADDLVKGDGKTVLIGADTNYPPFEFAADDGDGFQGFDVDLMNAIGEKLNVTFEFKTFDFEAIIAGLAAGTEFDMITSALTIKPERAEAVNFGLPYYQDSLALCVPNDSDIKSVADITDGTRVAVQGGSSAHTWGEANLPAGVKYVLNPDTTALFQSMLAGDADVLIQDLSSSTEFVKDAAFRATIVETIESDQFFGMAFQKNAFGDAMRADIDAALKELATDGTYAEIYKKWFGVEPIFLPGDISVDEALEAFGS
ncbi:MAG: ABC transporter substrate-binding protein [Coriobacteriia bacterium]|nr:ABC transporter substrate-binding protein [Coriobacteriia bacterium]